MNKVFFALILLSSFDSGVARDRSFPSLPHGYELVEPNSYQHSICDSSKKIVVPHRIVKLAVVADHVLGKSEMPPLESLRRGAVSGYFVLDTKTNQKWIGLEESEYLKLLREKKISVPSLNDIISP